VENNSYTREGWPGRKATTAFIGSEMHDVREQ